MFHKHDWEVKDKHVSPGIHFTNVKAEGYALIAMLDSMKEKVSWVVQCKSCGKVKRL